MKMIIGLEVKGLLSHSSGFGLNNETKGLIFFSALVTEMNQMNKTVRKKTHTHTLTLRHHKMANKK